jgi:hypothetical protein
MPAITVNSVAAEIAVDGGVREAQFLDGPRAHVVYTCNYADRYALVQGLLPSGRNVPHAYPPSPNLYAQECTGIEGIGPSVVGGWMHYKRARVGIEYRIPTWQYGFGVGGGGPSIDPATPGVDPSGQPWTSTTVEIGGEVLKLPTGAYVLSDGTPIEESAAGLIMPSFTIRVRRHRVLVIPLSYVEARVGGVNSHPIKLGDKVFPIGTLMLGGMNSSADVDTLGQKVNAVEYTLLGRGRGLQWNQFLAPDGAWKFANTASDGSGDYPYPYVPLHADGTTFLGLP